jgi:BMFP domain-containing protein YqiC
MTASVSAIGINGLSGFGFWSAAYSMKSSFAQTPAHRGYGVKLPRCGLFPCIAGSGILPRMQLTNLLGRDAMNQGPNRILDDFAKLMTDAAGAVQGVGKEVETAFKAQAERWLNSMDIVKREEFEAVREMAVKAREENDALSARIAELEAKIASLKS